MQAVSDEQLIQWIVDGDTSCLGTLFERHHVALYNFMLQMTRNKALSEDLVQETFLRVLKSARTFRAEASFRCWLFNIARNQFYDHLRKNKRLVPMIDDQLDQQAHPDADPEQQLKDWQRGDQFQRALAMLPDASREVIWLGRFELDSFDELGRALDCSAATARVRMHRAVALLKKTLGQLNEEPAHA